ncbi:MAG: tRNA (adenosine(37)-N6)-dimethylallyltransferase MiaA [Acidobacteria bacterium]|nr:tRNA (adenosine(37)-N6)-dimethylallyltransferase MiaA [Acidobacteriota bacterium]
MSPATGRSRAGSPAPMVVIVGPTGVGKSALAVNLALALRGGLISADAMQVYRGFDLGTAKPDAAARAQVRHELVDVADPRHDFSAGDFVRAADRAVSRLREEGLRPIMVGGTGFYIRAFLGGLFPGPRRSDSLRERLRARAGSHGPAYLQRLLARLDPESARRLGAGDTQRLIRALEVLFLSGEPLSQHLARDGGGIWKRPERYDAVKIGLRMEKARLVARLEDRAQAYFDAGLVDEVRSLLAAGIPPTANAFKGIGYRESLAVVRGEYSEAEARRRTVIATRQYAKRQMTWFRREPGLQWLAGDEPGENMTRAALAIIGRAG